MILEDITFIKLSLQDLDQLVSISQVTFSDAFADKNTKENFEYYLKNAFNQDALKSQLLNPNSEFYFAFKDNTLLGYLKFNFDDAQTDINDSLAMELERVYILKNYQNKGYGTLFLDFTIKLATNRDKDYIWLGVWDKNVKAIAFYERHGFKTFSSHPFKMGDDVQTDYLMKLNLG